MQAILAFLSALPIILTVVVSIAKVAPRSFAFLRALFNASKGNYLLKSGCVGMALSIGAFVGGIGIFVVAGYAFSLKQLTFLFDILMTPFSALVRSFLDLVLGGGCPQLPSTFSVFFGVLNVPFFMSIVICAICCEVFLRFFIYFVMRRGK